MKDDIFKELLASVKEGGAILRGEKQPSRVFTVGVPDVRFIRNRYHLSQKMFAKLLGISVKTLQNWEQHRRVPHGPALRLLQVAAIHPEALIDVACEQEKAAVA